jgi:protein-S-isoprenylcysteine O-methyltransferase Ste14
MKIALVPSLTAAACVAIYWITVLVKSIRISRVIRKDPNVIPREKTGQLLRVIWAPVILTWIVYPWLRLFNPAVSGLGWEIPGSFGAAACIFALAASFHCWREMGTSWRIGIDPKEKTEMIVSGAYRRLRHPIYALSILLVLGSLAASPSFVMLAVATIHSILMITEAVREEKYMLATHGQAYADYMKRTGRFLPRF